MNDSRRKKSKWTEASWVVWLVVPLMLGYGCPGPEWGAPTPTPELPVPAETSPDETLPSAQTPDAATSLVAGDAQATAGPPSPSAYLNQPVDRAQFADPPMSVRPLIRWWWPGGDVDDAELARELQQMSDAGFGGAEIQSFAVGLPHDAPPDVFTYGTSAWFDHVAAVLDQAQSLSLTIDLTLGSSWPCGGDHVNDAQSLKQLIASAEIIEGPATLDHPIPGPTEPVRYLLASAILQLPNTFDPEKMTLVAVVAARLDADQTPEQPPAEPTLPGLPSLEPTAYLDPASVVELTSSVTPDGRIQWQVPDGRWRVFTFYEGPTGSQSFYGADPGGGLVLDHLNADATAAHLQAIAQTAKDRFGPHVGTTLRSLFVDSLELRTELYWTDDLLAEFANRRGYRLEPFLPILFEPFQSDSYITKIYPDAPPVYDLRDIGPRVRHDYDQTVSELMIERFFEPIRQWAESNSLNLRAQLHGAPVDLLAASAHTTIPETEGLFADGRRSFLKMATSAAHLHGKPIVSSEVLAFKFRDYMTTPADILREANKHFAAGINSLVMHVYPYVYDTGFMPPGWMPFSSFHLPAWEVIGSYASHLNERNPFWRFLPKVNEYLARVQLVLQTGTPVADLALYTGQLNYPDDATFDPEITHKLERAGHNFDYVNDDVLLSDAEAHNQTLQVGTNVYKALVISEVNHLSYETAQRIAQFAQAGLPIAFVGDIPDQSTGYFDAAQRDALVHSTFEQLFGQSLETVRASDKFQSGSVLYLSALADLEDALADDLQIMPDVVLAGGGESIRYVHRRAGTADYYFMTNLSDQMLDTVATFTSNDRIPDLWDLGTGTVKPAPVYLTHQGRTGVKLHFEPDSSVVVGFETVGSPFHVEQTNLAGTFRDEQGVITGATLVPGLYSVSFSDGADELVKVGEGLPPLPPINMGLWDLVTIGPAPGGGVASQGFPMISLVDLSVVPELQHFSGLAVYATNVTIHSAYRSPGVNLELDLGEVYGVAELRINGQEVATVLAPPNHVDVTEYMIPGTNRIEVIVTTSLRNLLVGLREADDVPESPFGQSLVRSPCGLVGPVNLVPNYRITLDGQTGIDRPTTPIPFSLVITPANHPDDTYQDMIEAIHKAAELTNHVSFQWFWKEPSKASEPDGGKVIGCDQITPFVTEARSLGLDVTLQFQTFFVELAGENQPHRIHIANPLLPMDEASFADPELRDAYLQEIACLAALQPEYLVLGPEVNFVMAFDGAEFDKFFPVYEHAYNLTKSISPETQVGLSYQYDALREGLEHGDTWEYVRVTRPYDFIALTSYFGFTDERFQLYPLASEIEPDYYHPIRQLLGPDIPIIFTEVAWTSYHPYGLENQVLYLRRLPTLLHDVRPTNVFWALLHDIAYYEGPTEPLNTAGLLTRDGQPKPVWEEAQRLKQAGILVDPNGLPIPEPLPFSTTVVPINYPHHVDQDMFDAIGAATQISDHVSLQGAWKDPVTKEIFDCANIEELVAEARRLGAGVTVQFNTYYTIPSAGPGQDPTVLLMNPFVPAVTPDGDAEPLASFSIPELRDAYLQQIACIATLQPDCLVLGPEVNFLVAYRLDEFLAFAFVYRQAYDIVKSISPNTQVGLSYQYDGLRDGLIDGGDWTFMITVGPQDFYGMTTYFGCTELWLERFPTPADIPADYYDPLRIILGYDKPILFTEVAWSSFYAQGTENQVQFLRRLPELLEPVKPANVIWTLQHDIDNYYSGEIEALNYIGLGELDGTPKPAWNEVLRLKQQGRFVSP